jgi:hypothetical protein
MSLGNWPECQLEHQAAGRGEKWPGKSQAELTEEEVKNYLAEELHTSSLLFGQQMF